MSVQGAVFCVLKLETASQICLAGAGDIGRGIVRGERTGSATGRPVPIANRSAASSVSKSVCASVGEGVGELFWAGFRGGK